MNAFSDHPFQLRECQDSEGDRLRPLHKHVVRKTERELPIPFHLHPSELALLMAPNRAIAGW
jgi:hypothetical protein